MKVRELIDLLEDADPDRDVLMYLDDELYLDVPEAYEEEDVVIIRDVAPHMSLVRFARLENGDARIVGVDVLPRRDADLDRFLRSLATAWKDGESAADPLQPTKVGSILANAPRPFRGGLRRMVNWLELEPSQTKIASRPKKIEGSAIHDGLG